MARIVVGMSGGVDSSLTAVLLAELGHEVVGVTLKLWPCAEVDGGFTRADACCSPTETRDARAVAVAAGVRHFVIDAEDEFRRGVVDGFVADYAAGRTPSPCVRCNERIKFGVLWEHARALGAEAVATGHYARVERVRDRLYPRRSVDRAKDQTYFLFSLTQEQLAAARFPVGAMTKEQVREHARSRNLATADKHESQDLCFLGPGGVGAFLRRERPEAFRPGPIRDRTGRELGRHDGLAAFTIGQRKGLGIAGAAEPLFVVGLDAAENAVVLGPRHELETSEIRLSGCTWHGGPLPAHGLRVLARPRYRSAGLPATVLPDGSDGAVVRLDVPAVRAAAGQACVCYDPADDLCLGGGWVG